MHLSERPNERMVNVEVNHDSSDGECKGNVDAVSPGDENPGRMELGALLGRRPGGARGDLLPRASGLLSGGELDEVGGNEMAGDEKVEEDAEEDVLTAVVMAADTDEDAVLMSVSSRSQIDLICDNN